ncbi:MAG: peptidase domain-containing ABC transporter [Gammaproteobacteria bacterium]|nr:peptidase domain-containing ABC transporter [Gammaproteobacteria bacterium]MCY4165906.1 peptidase domain-containing ABC transporter [Gammaproteobacteria bacterium]MCY4340014.1 peptidase domain-containing ABC transporter [Gammaproteobacteria bacterium]
MHPFRQAFDSAIGRPRRLRHIPQHQQSECGLACLAMIADFHGLRMDLTATRAAIGGVGRGHTLQALMDAAEKLSLSGRPLKLEIEELPQLKTPCILHWNLDHYVVLEKVRKQRALILDPAEERRWWRIEQLDAHFTGVALELAPRVDFRSADLRGVLPLKSIARSFDRLARTLAGLTIIALAMQVLSLAPPILSQILIDEVTTSQDSELLRSMLIAMGLLAAIAIPLQLLQGWIGIWLSTSISLQTSRNLTRRLFSLPVRFFRERHVGDVVSRMQSLSPIIQFATGSVVTGIVNLLKVSVTGVAMLIYSPVLMLISLAGLALRTGIVWSVLPMQRRLARDGLVAGAKQSSAILESLRGSETMKALAGESERLAVWQTHLADKLNLDVRSARLGMYSGAGLSVLGEAEQIAFLGAGVLALFSGQITLGALFAFITLRGRFSAALAALIALFQQAYMLRLHAERLGDIVEHEAEPESGLPVGRLEGSFEAQRLGFAYGSNEGFVLRGFSCRIEPGQLVVLTGPSGSGKSTFLKLLAGLETPTEGRLLADGKEVGRLQRRDYRRRLGLVLQGDVLFRGSIAENISFFDPAPDPELIEKVAHLAAVDAEIRQFPMGMASQIGDMGSNLSGGQAQRILLARALYRRPCAMILDEATSHLDPATEERVVQMLKNLDITVVCAAHRPAILRHADQVLDFSAKNAGGAAYNAAHDRPPTPRLVG